MRYLITFSCYGAHLHGEDAGSVDRQNNLPGRPLVKPNSDRFNLKLDQSHQAPYVLDAESRTIVLDALREVCTTRGWNLWAAHVRTNHVHVVVESDEPPEKMMN